MESALKELIEVIRQSNVGIDWVSWVSAICSAISLVAIALLILERKEKKRPYLQAAFELLRSSLACVTIKNVGEVPAELHSLYFNKNFTKQLPKDSQTYAKSREDLHISIYPKQQWVICLGVATHEISNYNEKNLEVTLKYNHKGKIKKDYIEKEIVNFEDYNGFLVYISEIDELKDTLKTVTKSLNGIEKALSKYLPSTVDKIVAVAYNNLEDSQAKMLVTNVESNIE
ncbi:MAG: hypothetical protein RR423_02940 [Hydrogenoanaerobacterium sp.]